jgi:drug/metabolite transporter (DMT)-like permease
MNMPIWGNQDALLALAYLIVFGSIFAFTLYRYALKVLPVGFVTSYAYIIHWWLFSLNFGPVIALNE